MLKTTIQSTNIKTAAWENETLTIEFHNGRTYRYLKVPVTIYNGLIEAPSAGRYLNTQVIGKFEFKEDPNAQNKAVEVQTS